MDNLQNTTDSTGAEGATSSQEQSVVETQPATQEPTSSESAQTEAGSAQPWESDPRFKGKTAEDVWKSYQEAQTLIGKTSQKAKVAELIEQKYGVTADRFAEMVEQNSQAHQEQYYAENPLAPLQEQVQSLQQQIALQEEQKNLDSFIGNNPEYAPFKDKLLHIGLSLETDKSYEQIADEYFGQAIKHGQQSAYNKIEQKTNTQASGTATVQSKGKLTTQEIEALPLKERIAYLEQVLR
jgi:hypothetical protein